MKKLFFVLGIICLFVGFEQLSFAGPTNIYGVKRSKNFYGSKSKNSIRTPQLGKLSGVKKSNGTRSYGGLRNNYFGGLGSRSERDDSYSQQPRPTPECYGEARALCTK